MTHFLEITIQDHNSYYSLYADGKHSWKKYDKGKEATMIYYPPNTIVILYYTYPVHRTACVIRYMPDSTAGNMLPGLSKKVSILCSFSASRVDKLRRAAGWLNKNFLTAFSLDDGFYIRLAYIVEQRGKLNYVALRKLAEGYAAQKQIILEDE